MNCNGCKYDKDLTLEDVLFCTGCKRAYKKNTQEHKTFRDRYESKKNKN